MVNPQLPASAVVTPWKRRRSQGRVPEHLGIEVGVDVYETRGDDHAGGIDHRDRLIRDAADLDDMAILTRLHRHGVGVCPFRRQHLRPE